MKNDYVLRTPFFLVHPVDTWFDDIYVLRERADL